ncbi:neuronal membrane glycoprotein M6-b-like [Uloborus diversus]|uniref:neuronal membrane glycoprotein M6-b-like n=1 Tax=Uloborus diversus TaxID=327109 RepID=UPI002409CF0D|nr:neuronal membrane glycoprotein M6-b-like [Uloborus diversus]
MGSCAKCMTRVPYGTLIATIFCCVGVLAFLICLYRAVHLTLRMFEDVFTYNLEWLSDVHVIFIIVGALMGLLAVTLLVVGIFSTGATRTKIYRGWKSRIGGRISSAMCMSVVYILNLVWLCISGCLVVVVFVFYVLRKICEASSDCVDLQQFHFLFPNGTDINTLKICKQKKVFCTDTVNYAGLYYIIAFAASVLVIISLIHYIMCLAANYTRIKDQEKFKDLQELQYLQDSEMGTLPKDRF